MCGIAGRFGPGPSIAGLIERLAHRGPDSRGIVETPRGALGATRLRIFGDAGADQPIRSEDQRFLLVGNGEAFNEVAGAKLGPHESDLTRWLERFGRDGLSAFRAIRGPFALALFDRQEEVLWLARDERAVRPLFFRREAKTLWFASEAQALLEIAPLKRRPRGVDALLAFQFPREGESLFESFEEFPPGEAWRIASGPLGLQVERYPIVCEVGADEDLPAAWQSAFALQGPRGGAKAGITLSGGLDSSAVLGSLVFAGQAPEVAAVGYFPEGSPEIDERPAARLVAAHFGIPLIEVPISAARYREAWPKVMGRLLAPIAGPGSVSQWLVAEALAAEGVRVVYGGQGGDELFGGYERHRLLLAQESGRGLAPRAGYEELLPRGIEDPAAHLLFRGAPLLKHLPKGRADGLLAAARSLPRPGAGLADRLLRHEIAHLLPGLLLVDDLTLAAFGIEGRVPLLDPRLASLAMAIPLQDKSPAEDPRRLFRQLAAARVPPEVLSRRDKLGFPVPLKTWFAGPWRKLLQDRTLPDVLSQFGFDKSLYAAMTAGELPPRLLWFLISLSLSPLAQAGEGSEDQALPAAAVGQVG